MSLSIKSDDNLKSDDNFLDKLRPGGAYIAFKRTSGSTPKGSQKQHVGIGQLMLAVAPGNFLDDHGFATVAIDAPHPVQQEHQKPPERDEFVTPFRELIVTGRRLMATGTNRH